jgi:hypothetical protein
VRPLAAALFCDARFAKPEAWQLVVKVQQVARLGIAGKIKARGGGDAGTSLTTSNAEIARNT